ncbi:MAG: hypothetical protein C4297_06435 [Gemmataceae bacterium]
MVTGGKRRAGRPRLLAALAVLGAIAGLLAWFFLRGLDRQALRQQVLAALQQRFPYASIEIGDVQYRLWGDLIVKDIVLTDPPSGDGTLEKASGQMPADGAEPLIVVRQARIRFDEQAMQHGEFKVQHIVAEGLSLRLSRRADGTWNIQDLMRQGTKEGTLPPCSVRDLTADIVTHAQQPAWRVVVHRLQVEPGEGYATFQAQGLIRFSEKATVPIQANGQVYPRTGVLAARLETPLTSVDEAVVAPIVRLCTGQPNWDALQQVSGEVQLQADVLYDPSGHPAWQVNAQATVAHGRLVVSGLPGTIEDVSSSVRVRGQGVQVEDFRGRWQEGTLSGQGWIQLVDGSPEYAWDLTFAQLPVTPDWAERLPESLTEVRRVLRDFAPRGPVDIAIHIAQHQGRRKLAYEVRVHDLELTYVDFPYPLRRVRGHLAYREAAGQEPVLEVHLSGTAGEKPVQIRGRLFGAGIRPGDPLRSGIELEITGSGLMVDEALYRALARHPQAYRHVQEFAPHGPFGILVHVQRRPQSQSEYNHGYTPAVETSYRIEFQGMAFCFAGFPYPLENVRGILRIAADDTWELHEVTGWHAGGRIVLAGHYRSGTKGKVLELSVEGQSFALDDSLARALQKYPDAYRIWEALAPAGRADFRARWRQESDSAPELILDEVQLVDCRIRPRAFPYTLHGVQGRFRYERGQVHLGALRFRHGKSLLALAGGTIALRDPLVQVRLERLTAEPLYVDRELVEALPERLAGPAQWIGPNQPLRVVVHVAFTTDLAHNQLTELHWDGHITVTGWRHEGALALEDASGVVALRGSYDGKHIRATGALQADRLVLARHPFEDLRGRIILTDDPVYLQAQLQEHRETLLEKDAVPDTPATGRAPVYLVIPGIYARLHGGEVYGPIRIEIDRQVRYVLDLTASQVDLERFARQTLGRTGQVQGRASAWIYLVGKDRDIRSLRGRGGLSIPQGRLYDLPLILDLLTFLSGRLPKGAAFQEAYARFTVVGQEIQITRLDLLGDALTLRGQGRIRTDLSGLDLEMYGLLWGRTLPLLPPLIDRIPPAISKQLMKIHIRGSLAKVRITTEPLPVLTEPLKQLLEQLAEPRKADDLRKRP